MAPAAFFWLDGAEAKALAFRRVEEWHDGVSLQARRLLFDGSKSIADIHFFFVAARNLKRAAESIADHYRDAPTKTAVATFDSATAGSRDLRDFLEHFEEYDWRVGRAQKQGRVPEQRAGSTEVITYPPGDVVVEILGVSASVAATQAAAHALAKLVIARRGDVPDW